MYVIYVFFCHIDTYLYIYIYMRYPAAFCLSICLYMIIYVLPKYNNIIVYYIMIYSDMVL